MRVSKWVKSFVLLALGSLCLVVAYNLYSEYGMRDKAIRGGHQVWMKIKSRRPGRPKSPAYIEVQYAGREYNLESSRSYYEATLSADSVLVYYDPKKDVASLPGWKVQKLSWLSIMVAF
jgi:hypothetical protein